MNFRLYTISARFLWLGFSDQFSHVQIIQDHYVYLVENLVAKDSRLIDELIQAEVLSSEEQASIGAEVISSAQNKMLLSVLNRKTNAQFDKFLDALDKTRQQYIRKEISKKLKCVSYCILLLLLKPRLHDTAGCQTGCTTGLTTGCIVQTNIQPVVNPVVKPV